MSQTSVQRDFDRGYAGMKADSRFDHVDSLQAFEATGIGLGVVKRVGYDNQYRLPKANRQTILFDADLVASNTIDMDINGVAISTVTFATDHDTTMEALRAEIESNADVATAVLTDTGGDNRTIQVNAVDGTEMAITSIVVALGASQASATVTTTSTDSLFGIVLQSHDQEQASDGSVSIPQYKAGNILRQGAAFVTIEEAVTSDDSVYMRTIDGGTGKAQGQFRNDADSATCVLVSGARFVNTITAAGVGIVEINLP